jgi:hypothetical protein
MISLGFRKSRTYVVNMSNTTNDLATLSRVKKALVAARLQRTRLSRLPLGVPFQVRANMLAELSLLDARADALYAACPACQ